METALDEQPLETTTYSLGSETPPPSERRNDDDRHLTLFRVGAMDIDGRRELCLIKNISAGGMMIRPYCTLAEGTSLVIELKTGTSVPGTVAWVKDGNAGVAFGSPVDVLEIVSHSASGARPRMPRIAVDCVANVRDGARNYRMRVSDISQGGVKVDCPVDLEPGCDLIVTLPGLSPHPGVLRWIDGGHAGITFNRLIPLSELVEWLRALRDERAAA